MFNLETVLDFLRIDSTGHWQCVGADNVVVLTSNPANTLDTMLYRPGFPVELRSFSRDSLLRIYLRSVCIPIDGFSWQGLGG